MGNDGKHARFSIASGAARALGVAFGSGTSIGPGDGTPVDAAVRLELNQWNGSVEPRVVLRDLYPIADGDGNGETSRTDAACAACPPAPQVPRGGRGYGPRSRPRSRRGRRRLVAAAARRASVSSIPRAPRSRPSPSLPPAGRRSWAFARTCRGATGSPSAPIPRGSAAASLPSSAAAALRRPVTAPGQCSRRGACPRRLGRARPRAGAGGRVRPCRARRPAAVRPPRGRRDGWRRIRPRRMGCRTGLRAGGARVRVGAAPASAPCSVTCATRTRLRPASPWPRCLPATGRTRAPPSRWAAACACSRSSASSPGRRTAANRHSGSYPRSGRNSSDRVRTSPTRRGSRRAADS